VGTPINDRILKRVHCSNVWQYLEVKVIHQVDDFLPYEAAYANVTYTFIPSPTVCQVWQNNQTKLVYLQGIKPGTCTLTVVYLNLTQTIPSITISNSSILLNNIYITQDFHLFGFINTTVLLNRFYGNLPYEYDIDLITLYSANLVTISLPPSGVVGLTGDYLVLKKNSYQVEKIIFSLPLCENTVLNTSIDITVNLLPTLNDVDIDNNLQQLPIQIPSVPALIQVPIYINAWNISGFLITLALDWANSNVQCDNMPMYVIVTCAANDPVGYITITGVFTSPSVTRNNPNGTLIQVATITTMSSTLTGGLHGNVSLLFANMSIQSANLIAGVWMLPTTPLWSLDKQNIVNLSQAYTLVQQNSIQESLNILKVLTHQQWILYDILLYSTNFELSILLRFQDLYGNLVSDQTSCKILLKDQDTGKPYLIHGLSSTNEPYLWGTYKYDGWWGVQIRQQMSKAIISIQVEVVTYDALGNTDANRLTLITLTQTLNTTRRIMILDPVASNQSVSIPFGYFSTDGFTTGEPFYKCPRLAHHHAYVLLHMLSWTPVTQTDLVSIACSIHVPINRILITPYLISNTSNTSNPQQYKITFILESLLRAHDVRSMMPSNMIKLGQTYEFHFKDDPQSCPDKMYFADNGMYKLLPPHGVALPECYGFECEKDMQKNAEQKCVPVRANWFWTIVILVLLSVMVWAILVTVVAVFSRSYINITGVMKEPSLQQESENKENKENEEEEPTPVNPFFDPKDVLPIHATKHGELEYELEEFVPSLSPSSASSESHEEEDNIPIEKYEEYCN
jgi:hypothetical protein